MNDKSIIKLENNTLTDAIFQALCSKFPNLDTELFSNFIACFYSNTTQEDLNSLPKVQIIEKICHLWQFFYSKKTQDFSLQIYKNKSGNTVINVITENMSFVLDSFYMILGRLSLKPLITLHPTANVSRDHKGNVLKIIPPNNKRQKLGLEAIICCEVIKTAQDIVIDDLKKEITETFEDIKNANDDWHAMRSKIIQSIEEFKKCDSTLKTSENDKLEVINFLEWVENSHFTFLGYCNYDLLPEENLNKITKKVTAEPALGILKERQLFKLSTLFNGIKVGPKTIKYIRDSFPIVINKTSLFSKVHRSAQMDCIGIRRYNGTGEVIGIRIFVGLFTSVAYSSSASDVPWLRDKVKKIIKLAGFTYNWHDGRALSHILDSLPRDELFQASVKELKRIGLAILKLRRQPRTALFVRRDKFNRFLSCLVYIPRDRFDSSLCDKISTILEKEFNGKVNDYKAQFGSLQFARVCYTVVPNFMDKKRYEISNIEEKLIIVSSNWSDYLSIELKKKFSNCYELFERYKNAFDKGYQEKYHGNSAVEDIIEIETILKNINNPGISIRIHNNPGIRKSFLKLKIYSKNIPLPLSDIIPIIENLGMKVMSEVPFHVSITDLKIDVWIHDFCLEPWEKQDSSNGITHENFTETLLKAYNNEIENDCFNRLVTRADLDYRQCNIFRAYAKYIRLAGLPFNRMYISETLVKNAHIVQALSELFIVRFKVGNKEKELQIENSILKMLDSIIHADEDRIISLYLKVIKATVRTNAFQKDKNNYKKYVSFKIAAQKLDFLPRPKPLYEIFVYSAFMEAIHLRGGKVARGGIRWSDRHEDYRTEILGLQKAQMVKNTLIVPVGSKGGFIVKVPLIGKSREEITEIGINCYQTMIKGLLDITDNLINGKVKYPKDIIVYDDADPYLVVAADKGTATFSDFGNSIAIDYNFWLGDAFASGGSVGYDHKKMGITARGAWEAVKQHFLGIGKDIQKTPFNVIGVGDMSGDIFGNGMLLSKKIRLIAAFNHTHIFVDPNPDIVKTYKERLRVFKKSRSTWDDFDKQIISSGGGIFSRSAKKINITPQIQELLGIDSNNLKPNEFIKYILKCKADLLWFGGIGTYVKSSTESNHDVGDRNNDNVRVNAKDLQSTVIGEGANLACTQLARIEFEKECDGKINTDAIDNSAGVSCSDREVNLKILFNDLIDKKQISIKERNSLLESMTDDVGKLILRDNFLQPQAITIIKNIETGAFDQQVKLIRQLEQEKVLDRQIEFLPDDQDLIKYQANQIYLTRPEISVLMGYSKISYYDKVLHSTVLADPYFQKYLQSYFPEILQQRYSKDINRHPLKHEIIATYIINEITHRMGASYIQEAINLAGVSIGKVIHAFFVVVDVLDITELWNSINSEKCKICEKDKIKVLLDLYHILRRMTLWMICNYPMGNTINETIVSIKDDINLFLSKINEVLDDNSKDKLSSLIKSYNKLLLPTEHSRRLALLGVVSVSSEVLLIATESGYSVPRVAELYFQVGNVFYFNYLKEIIEKTKVFSSAWEKRLIINLSEDLFNYQGDMVSNILDYAKQYNIAISQTFTGLLGSWHKAHKSNIQNIDSIINESQVSDNFNINALCIITREIRQLSGN